MRIVSLLPGATEIVAALGAGAALVGRSHECDLPAGVSALPAVTRALVDAEAPGSAIDAAVRDLIGRGLSIYWVDPGLLADLAPDVIVTQTQCAACAATPADLDAALAAWLGRRPAVVSLEAASLDGIAADIGAVAQALGLAAQGQALVQGLRERLAAIAARTAGEARPRVATIEWLEPLMAAGNWIPELIGIAGGTPLHGTAGAHSPWIDWAALAEADPDVILVMPCGFDLARTRCEFAAIADRPEWRALRAVRTGATYLLDGTRHFNRPGPRLHESAEILAEILHPARCRFGHEGHGWMRTARG